MINNYQKICNETADLDTKETSQYIKEDVMGFFSQNTTLISDGSLELMAAGMCDASMTNGCEHCMCECCCSGTRYADGRIVYEQDGFEKWLTSNCYYPSDVINDNRQCSKEHYIADPYKKEMESAGLSQADFI